MTNEEREHGRWQGRIEATQEAHGRRLSRLEAAMIALAIYLASRSVEVLFGQAGI